MRCKGSDFINGNNPIQTIILNHANQPFNIILYAYVLRLYPFNILIISIGFIFEVHWKK